MMQKQNSKTIALYGGSFDPPHIGHVAIVKALLNFKDIEKVVVMPTFLNPFKSHSHASSTLRLKWLKKIFTSFINVEIDSFEVKKNRPVPTIESVEYLLKKFKNIYLVIGADNLDSIHKWCRYEELKKLVTFVVVSRDNIVIPKGYINLDVNVDISSTELREHMQISKIPQICALEINTYYKENNAN